MWRKIKICWRCCADLKGVTWDFLFKANWEVLGKSKERMPDGRGGGKRIKILYIVA
jgi:hypothetical protein